MGHTLPSSLDNDGCTSLYHPLLIIYRLLRLKFEEPNCFNRFHNKDYIRSAKPIENFLKGVARGGGGGSVLSYSPTTLPLTKIHCD